MLETQEFPTSFGHGPSYRSIIFSSCTRENDLDFYFDDDTPLTFGDIAGTKDGYLRWVIDHFQNYVRVIEEPWMIVHGDYLLLKDWRPRAANLEAIRENGLSVFMFEPLSISPMSGRSPSSTHEPPQYAELEKLSNFVRENGVNKPVTVYVCERGLDKFLKHDSRFENLRFKSFNSYLLKTIRDAAAATALPERKLNKKFICLNFRYEPIREMLVGYFAAKGYLDFSYVSFYHRHNMEEFYRALPLSPEELPEFPTMMEGVRRIQKYLPMSLEAQNPLAVDPVALNVPDLDGQHNVTNQAWLMMDYVPQTFLFTYCESRPFSPRSVISEKTVHPILAKKPFLPFAGSFFLEGMREMGFRTFSDFWDESYDRISDPARRFSKFLKTVDSIAALPMAQLSELQKRIEPVVNHNYEWITKSFSKEERQSLAKRLSRPADFTELPT